MRRQLLVFTVLLLALPACHSPEPRPAAAPPVSDSAPPPSSAAAPSPSSGAGLSPGASPSPSGQGCTGRLLARMSPEEQAGQLLMIGTPVDAPRGLAEEVTRYRLGGVFLAGRSKRSAAALRADIAALQGAAGTPLLVALDQEGGDVQTLQGADFPDIPSALRLGAGPPAKLRSETRDSARRLAAIGVTMNLAPVADTVPASIGADNPPIGAFHRQYGADPAKVGDSVRTVVKASQDAGVLTTLKHFPGLGRTRFNTDTTTKAVDATATTHDPFLGPFAAGIDEGTAAVMVSSASYPKLDAKGIAAFSEPIITGLLRRQLGFTGLVVSDDIGAAAAVRAVKPGDRAVRFVRAGGDLVLSIRPEDAAPMVAALRAEARSSPAFASRVADAAAHVLRAKAKAGLLTC